ncbi:Erythronolide synthase, modules 5 and 6 [Streptomyces sp. MP131-18]|nr:Erythronolide synthase, modules 5 and 6 [Streptomyces sp. MP131-18]
MHSAGTATGALVVDTTAAELEAVSAVKVGGALHLHELTLERGLDLDAFVTFSSGAAVWGSGILAAYGAANAALDALVARRRAAGLAGTSVAWGLWGGGGMGAGEAGEQLSSYGLRPMAAERGIQGLAQALDDGEDQLVVADIDWDRFLPTYTVFRPSPLLSTVPEAIRANAAEAENEQEAETSIEAAALRKRLAAAPSPLERETILLDVVREHAAAVLGHTGAAAVQPDTTFLEQGFNSLSAVELRNRLARVTGLRLTGPMMLDHPTPTATAAHLRELFATDQAGEGGTDQPAPRFLLPAAPQADGPPAGPPDPRAAASSSLTALYLRAHSSGRGADAMRMITGLGAFRPSFTSPEELAGIPPLVPLTRGPEGPTLICLPSFGGTADAQEFVRLAHGFRGKRQILAVTVPGYIPGEPLAAGPDALLDLYAGTVLGSPEAAADAGPFVLVGYSSGGVTAHALAARLAERGRPPAALVLLDTFTPDRAGVSDEVISELPAAVLANNVGADGIGGDDWLIACGHYYDFDWRAHLPHAAGLPTLLIRHADGDDGAADFVQVPWAYSGDVTPVAVPGDHFSMIGSRAETTALAVESWLATRFTATQDRDDD